MSAYAENRGWMGHLVDDPMRMALQLELAQTRFGEPQHLLSFGGPDGLQFTEPAEPGQPLPDGARMSIPEPLARLLWELLNAHYGGPGPSRDLRGDYVAERARVDRLIEAVISPPRVVLPGPDGIVR